MSATILHLHPTSPIGHYFRLGHTGHRQLDDLHASGRLAVDRVVVDAAHIVEQKELLDSLRSTGTEIVLDPQVAELSTPGGYLTSAHKLPWAHPSRPYSVDDFDRNRIFDMAARIAEFTIVHEADVVLAPTRLLDGPQDAWLPIDAETCVALRSALDAQGANAIAVDYPLLTNYQTLLDGAARKALAFHLADLPFDYSWLRTANFGADKSAAGVRKYINAIRDFHEVGKPIIADGVGGLSALGIVSLGAAGGICHGVAEKERFYPYYWRKPKKTDSGGGAGKRIYFANIDMYMNEEQSKALLSTRSAKPLLGCRDTGCCSGGWEDMILNPKTHYLTQTTRRMRDLAGVPELRRAEHFFSRQLAPADRIARNALRLKVADQKVMDKLFKGSRKIDDLRRVLEELHTTDHNLSRSRAPAKRARRSGTASKSKGA